jgi:hypothetical protein
MGKIVRDQPGRTIREEAVWPTRKQLQMVERLLRPYLDDLRKAGLPE